MVYDKLNRKRDFTEAKSINDSRSTGEEQLQRGQKPNTEARKARNNEETTEGNTHIGLVASPKMNHTNQPRNTNEEQPQQTPNTKTRTEENNGETTEGNAGIEFTERRNFELVHRGSAQSKRIMRHTLT